MIKKFIPTIVAIIVLIAIIIYASIFETEELNAPGYQNPVSVLNITDSDILSLEFGKGDKYEIKVVCSNGNYKIVSPIEYLCENSEINTVITTLVELEATKVIKENVDDLSAFGINQNSQSIRINQKGRIVELLLGNKVPVENSYYISKKGENHIYVIPLNAKSAWGKTLDDLRQRALFPENFGNCSNIEYSCDIENFNLVKGNYSEWFIENTEYSADSVEVTNLISSMQNLRISKFIDSNDVASETFGFDKPSLIVKIINEYGKEFKIVAGNLQGSDTYVSVDGKIVQFVNTVKLNELRLTLNDVRDKYLPIPLMNDIESITVRNASGTKDISRKDKNWYCDNIIVSDADVKAFLKGLKEAKINLYETPHDYELYGLNATETCDYISIKSKSGIKNYWLGNTQGMWKTILDDNEMIVINTELDNTFKTFCYRISNK